MNRCDYSFKELGKLPQQNGESSEKIDRYLEKRMLPNDNVCYLFK